MEAEKWEPDLGILVVMSGRNIPWSEKREV